MFITFEGGEGSGKTTHINLLAEFLRSKGKDVLITREPGGTSVGSIFREILLQNKDIERATEIFLFAADRVEHVEKVIKPAIEKGKAVLCDRYIDSTIAYQLGGRGLPEDLVRYVNWISSRGLVPDLTILLDLPVKEGLARAKERSSPDKFESEILAFHERVREKYREIADGNMERVKVVESGYSVEDAQKKIIQAVIDKFFKA